VKTFGISIIERKGKGEDLASYAYRDPLSLLPEKIGVGK